MQASNGSQAGRQEIQEWMGFLQPVMVYVADLIKLLPSNAAHCWLIKVCFLFTRMWILTFPLYFTGKQRLHKCGCKLYFSSVQFSSVTQSRPTLCDNCSAPGFPVHHQVPEFTHTHVHWVGDAIQPSHPLSSPFLAPSPSQHQGRFQWVNSSQIIYGNCIIEFLFRLARIHVWWLKFGCGLKF